MHHGAGSDTRSPAPSRTAGVVEKKGLNVLSSHWCRADLPGVRKSWDGNSHLFVGCTAQAANVWLT